MSETIQAKAPYGTDVYGEVAASGVRTVLSAIMRYRQALGLPMAEAYAAQILCSYIPKGKTVVWVGIDTIQNEHGLANDTVRKMINTLKISGWCVDQVAKGSRAKTRCLAGFLARLNELHEMEKNEEQLPVLRSKGKAKAPTTKGPTTRRASSKSSISEPIVSLYVHPVETAEERDARIDRELAEFEAAAEAPAVVTPCVDQPIPVAEPVADQDDPELAAIHARLAVIAAEKAAKASAAPVEITVAPAAVVTPAAAPVPAAPEDDDDEEFDRVFGKKRDQPIVVSHKPPAGKVEHVIADPIPGFTGKMGDEAPIEERLPRLIAAAQRKELWAMKELHEMGWSAVGVRPASF